jgi:hypothetical protein
VDAYSGFLFLGRRRRTLAKRDAHPTIALMRETAARQFRCLSRSFGRKMQQVGIAVGFFSFVATVIEVSR